jgi:hypothetical protein
MKKVFFVLFLLSSISCFGQGDLSVEIAVKNPIPDLEMWRNNPDILQIRYNNTSNQAYRVSISLILKSKDGILIKIPPTTTPIHLPPGVTTLQADAIAQEGRFVYLGMPQGADLPAGDYEICVYTEILSLYQPPPPDCEYFSIDESQLTKPAYTLPTLQKPPNHVVVTDSELHNLDFIWTPVTPEAPFGITYELIVVQKRDNQSPAEAIENNIAMIVEVILEKTSWRFPTNDHLQPGIYAWTVRPKDENGSPLISNVAKVEPFLFEVTSEP